MDRERLGDGRMLSQAEQEAFEQPENLVSFRMNEQRDLPLLLLIRNATFISHAQLLQRQTEAGLETNPRAFYGRVKRFVTSGLIRIVGTIPPYAGRVYTITRLGLGVLESYGEGLMSVSSGSRNLPGIVQAPHFLELNEIRESFRKTGKLVKWRWERELSSLNLVIGTPMAKDYDAVAELNLGGEPYRIAIEFERTMKASARYQEIQKVIRDEGNVDMILYFTATVDQIFSLSAEFGRPGIPMCFASSRKFQALKFDVLALFCYEKMRETLPLVEVFELALPLRN